MKVYDCFMFMNELELLELRLMTLNNVVDYFVLVEAGMTHSCKPKSLYFNENKERFGEYLDKIIHIKVDTLPYTDSWKNENYNRNLLMQGLTNAEPDDYIIVSDVDEIPNPVTLKWGIERGFDLFILKQKLFYYYVNCLQKQEWSGPVICKKRKMTTTQELRKIRQQNINLIDYGGWHYSYLGGVEAIKTKIAAYAESIDNNKPEINNTEHILKCLENGDDILNRTADMFKKRFLNINELDHPQLNEWLKKYPQMIKL